MIKGKYCYKYKPFTVFASYTKATCQMKYILALKSWEPISKYEQSYTNGQWMKSSMTILNLAHLYLDKKLLLLLQEVTLH